MTGVFRTSELTASSRCHCTVTSCIDIFSFHFTFLFFCVKLTRLDWIVQCFTSPPTQYRLYGRQFLQVKRPNQQYQSTEGESYKIQSK